MFIPKANKREMLKFGVNCHRKEQVDWTLCGKSFTVNTIEQIISKISQVEDITLDVIIQLLYETAVCACQFFLFQGIRLYSKFYGKLLNERETLLAGV